MSLTKSQSNTLKAYIQADPTLGPLTSGPGTDLNTILNAMNADANPVVLAWRVGVPPTDSDSAPDYTTFDSIVPGKRESWAFFLNFPRDYTITKVRKWVTDVWGAATANSNAEAILQAATENASRAENVLGGNVAANGTVSALKRTWVGDLVISDISAMFPS